MWLAFLSDDCSPTRGCGKGDPGEEGVGPFVTNSAIFKIRADGSSRARLTPDQPKSAPYDGQLTWSPDGTRIAFYRWVEKYFNTAIFTIRPDGSGLRRLTRGWWGW